MIHNITRWCDKTVEGNSMASRMSPLIDPETNKVADGAIERLRALRGNGAIQTLKQFNFINEWAELRQRFLAGGGAALDAQPAAAAAAAACSANA